MDIKKIIAVIIFAYIVVPITVYLLDLYLPPDLTIKPENNILCLNTATQMAKDRVGTQHENNNFYRSCLLELECIRLEDCPMSEIKRVSENWKAEGGTISHK